MVRLPLPLIQPWPQRPFWLTPVFNHVTQGCFLSKLSNPEEGWWLPASSFKANNPWMVFHWPQGKIPDQNLNMASKVPTWSQHRPNSPALLTHQAVPNPHCTQAGASMPKVPWYFLSPGHFSLSLHISISSNVTFLGDVYPGVTPLQIWLVSPILAHERLNKCFWPTEPSLAYGSQLPLTHSPHRRCYEIMTPVFD